MATFIFEKLEVCPLLVAERDGNLASGNIKFNGDVVVKGNGMRLCLFVLVET